MGRGANTVTDTGTASRHVSSEPVALDQLSNPGYSLFARVATGGSPSYMNPIEEHETDAAQELVDLGLAQTGVEEGTAWVSLTELGNDSWVSDADEFDEYLD